MGAQPAAEPLRQPLVGQRGQLVQSFDAVRLQPGGGLGADARYQQGEEGPNRTRASSAVSMRKPSGLSASEATLATSLFGPMPIEQASPVVRVTAALMRRPAALGRSTPVRSRYASSSPTTSTVSTWSCSTSMTARERSR